MAWPDGPPDMLIAFVSLAVSACAMLASAAAWLDSRRRNGLSTAIDLLTMVNGRHSLSDWDGRTFSPSVTRGFNELEVLCHIDMRNLVERAMGDALTDYLVSELAYVHYSVDVQGRLGAWDIVPERSQPWTLKFMKHHRKRFEREFARLKATGIIHWSDQRTAEHRSE